MVDVAIVEHDPDMLPLFEDEIARLGFTCVGFVARGRTHEETCTFIRETNARVVLYDLGAPPYDQALRRWERVCRAEGCGDAHYILSTTSSRPIPPFDPSPCKATVAVLHRPFNTSELLQGLDRALSPVRDGPSPTGDDDAQSSRGGRI